MGQDQEKQTRSFEDISLSENLLNLFTQQFSTYLMLRLQQQGSKLRDRVMSGMHVGKAASPVQYAAPVAMESPSGRFAPLNRVDTTFQRRWVFPTEREMVQLIDSFDRLQTIVDPTSQYTMNAANAAGRAIDDISISAAFGSSQTGTDTGTLSSEAFSDAATASPSGSNSIAD